MNTGEKIRLYRENCGLTQVQLAKKVGVARRTIINYENGVTFPKEKRVITALSHILGVSFDELIGETEPQSEADHPRRNPQEIIDSMCALFEGNELSSEDKEEALRIVTESYWSARMKKRGSAHGRFGHDQEE